jgi:hypothetical protein
MAGEEGKTIDGFVILGRKSALGIFRIAYSNIDFLEQQ